jgi:hypothetical protein
MAHRLDSAVLRQQAEPVPHHRADRHHIVHAKSPIGYLPLYTIRDILKMETHALAQDSAAKGLSAALFGPAQCCIKSGALYLFDRQSLELLLQSSRPILSASRWPLDPDQFVGRIAPKWIDPGHPVTPVIKRAFGEVASS